MNEIRPSRSYSMIEPNYRLCRWCGIVRNIGRDECPPHLRSEYEQRLAIEEARVVA